MTQATQDLTISRTFDAPRELVFKAWTDPELLAQWWGPHGVTNQECEVDPKVGGKIRVVMLAGEELGEMAGQRWPMEGEFLEFVENEKIVFKNQAVREDGEVLIDGLTTVTFEDDNGGTAMTMHTFAKAMAPEAVEMLKGMEAGWTQSIDKLTNLLTK